jgi:hypothetical protein
MDALFQLDVVKVQAAPPVTLLPLSYPWHHQSAGPGRESSLVDCPMRVDMDDNNQNWTIPDSVRRDGLFFAAYGHHNTCSVIGNEKNGAVQTGTIRQRTGTVVRTSSVRRI